MARLQTTVERIKPACNLCGGAKGWDNQGNWVPCELCEDQDNWKAEKAKKEKNKAKKAQKEIEAVPSDKPSEEKPLSHITICKSCEGKGGDYKDGEFIECFECEGVGSFYDPPADENTDGSFSFRHPKRVTQTRRVEGRLFVAGEHLGENHERETSEIMFVSPAALVEECGKRDFHYRKSPRNQQEAERRDRLASSMAGVLRGPPGSLFRNMVTRAYLDLGRCYYTNVVKWDMDTVKGRLSPSPKALRFALPCLEEEIKRVKPKIIVCLGKCVFDHLWDGPKFKKGAIDGAWVYDEQRDLLLYVMDHITAPLSKPMLMAKWDVDLSQIRIMADELNGKVRQKVPLHYETIFNSVQLQEWITRMEAENNTIFSVDCEWGSKVFTQGNLRSIQFCWKPGHAVYVRFMDENMKYVFDVSYEEAGKIMKPYLDLPNVKYIGHSFASDAVWMRHWLNLETYQKCIFDSMYATQCVNEYADMKLERLALVYTDLGRYDFPLTLWKKKNKVNDDEGYGRVPDDIIIPYAIRDVDVVMRSYYPIMVNLMAQNLDNYYINTVLPYVTDLFTEFTYEGIPVDRDRLNLLRDVFYAARIRMERDLLVEIKKEARIIFQTRLTAFDPVKGPQVADNIIELLPDHVNDALTLLKDLTGPTKLSKLKPTFDHLADIGNFNLQSSQQKCRWLFDVKGHTPLRTTGNKAAGVPSMSWDKVLEWPEEKRKTVTPSTDKNTLKVLAEKDPMVSQLLQLSMIATVTRNLKNPNEEGGEEGLHKWLCSDGKVHCNFSTTETNRPRSWKPNILNWTKQVVKEISIAFEKTYTKEIEESDRIRDELIENLKLGSELKDKKEFWNDAWWLFDNNETEMFREWYLRMSAKPLVSRLDEFLNTLPPTVYPLRSCVRFPDGMCGVESDLQTAEIVALAYISGCPSLLGLINDPDVQFVFDKDDKDCKKPKRICYADYCDIPTEHREYKNSKGEIEHMGQNPAHLHDPNNSKWQRNVDGSLKHPKRDMHWETVESVMEVTREDLTVRYNNRGKDVFRDGYGKPGNFRLCIASGELVLTDHGLIPIQDVQLHHRVWDGVEWVNHEGVIYQGEKHVIEYQGLRATPDHEVWVESGEKISLEEACKQCLNLTRTASESGQVVHTGFESVSGDGKKSGRGLLQSKHFMHSLWDRMRKRAAQFGEGLLQKVQMLERCLPQRSSENLRGEIRFHASEVLPGHSCLVPQLQRSWDTSGVRICSRIYSLGFGDLARAGLQRLGFRSNRKRRELFKGKSPVGKAVCQSYEQAGLYGVQKTEGRGLHEEIPGSMVCFRDVCKPDQRGFNRGGNCCSVSKEQGCSRTEEVEKSDSKTKVYDLLNAGKLRRFTCSGVLVSNCYGAGPGGIEQGIEVATLQKPEPGTGQKIIDSFARRFPGAQAFLEQMMSDAEEGKHYRSITGRIRHCYIFNEAFSSEIGLTDFQRSKVSSPLSRELRNFPMQNHVGDHMAKAGVRLQWEYRQRNMQAKIPILLYDAFLSLCPVQERFQVSDLHQQIISEGIRWKVHGLDFGYDIDTDLVTRWSSKTTRLEKKFLNDRNWSGSLFNDVKKALFEGTFVND